MTREAWLSPKLDVPITLALDSFDFKLRASQNTYVLGNPLSRSRSIFLSHFTTLIILSFLNLSYTLASEAPHGHPIQSFSTIVNDIFSTKSVEQTVSQLCKWDRPQTICISRNILAECPLSWAYAL